MFGRKKRARKMIEMNFGKDPRKEVNLSKDQFLAKDYLEQIIQSSQALIMEKKIKVQVNQLEELEVVTDGVIFYKVLDNLFSNALQYSEEGGIIKIDLLSTEIRMEN